MQVKDEMKALKFDELTEGINQLLEDDLESCLTESFKKLDIMDEGHLSIEALRAAVQQSIRLHMSKGGLQTGDLNKKQRD